MFDEATSSLLLFVSAVQFGDSVKLIARRCIWFRGAALQRRAPNGSLWTIADTELPFITPDNCSSSIMAILMREHSVVDRKLDIRIDVDERSLSIHIPALTFHSGRV